MRSWTVGRIVSLQSIPRKKATCWHFRKLSEPHISLRTLQGIGYYSRCLFWAELRCQDVREFRETEGLALQRLIRGGTPVGIAFENHRPVRSEGHVPANKDKVGTRLVRNLDVAQRGIPI